MLGFGLKGAHLDQHPGYVPHLSSQWHLTVLYKVTNAFKLWKGTGVRDSEIDNLRDMIIDLKRFRTLKQSSK